MATFSWTVCTLVLAALGVLMAMAYAGIKPVSLSQYRHARLVFGLGAIVFAILTAYRVISELISGPREGLSPFLSEYLAYIVLWTLAPPVWFFFEFYAADHGWIRGSEADGKTDLKNVKDYADFASKIWAAFLALLIGSIALYKK